MVTIAINHGTVVDTREKKCRKLHVGLEGSRVAVLSETPLQGERVIDASGCYVSPGFIDVHGHIDGELYPAELSACQGVTTTVGGNCGYSPADLELFFRTQEEQGFPIHQAMLVGHGTPLREAVGATDRYKKADARQIARMVSMAEEAMEQGACGISFGLDYVPGCAIEEVEALADAAARYGRICPVHTRLLTEGDLYSLFEVIKVAEQTGVHMLISHFVYQYCEGLVEQALHMVDRARGKGLSIHIDSGMYTNWSTYFDTATFDHENICINHWRWEQMVVATGQYKGRVMDEELFFYMKEHCPHEALIFFEGKEEEVYQCLVKDYAVPSSDTGSYGRGEGHPQIAGTFPRYLRKMVREEKLLSVEEAVYKATFLPARLFGLDRKGCLEPGMDADLVVFSMEEVCDRSDYPHLGMPDAKPVGIPYVIVDGVCVVEDGQYQDTRTGKVIRERGDRWQRSF